MIWKLWHWESQYNHIHPEHFHTLSLVIGMVYLLPVLCMTKVDLRQRFSIHSFSACTLKLITSDILWYILGFLYLMWCIRTRVSNEWFILTSNFFNGYTFCAHIHGLSLKLNKPGYKDCFGRRKMEARRREILRKTTAFFKLHTHSYRSICRRIYRIKYVFF